MRPGQRPCSWMLSSAGALGRGVGRHLAPACCPHSSHGGGWRAWYGGAGSVAPRGDGGVCLAISWPLQPCWEQRRWCFCLGFIGHGLAGHLVDGRLEAEGPAGKEGRVVCMRLGLRAMAPEPKGQCGEPVPFADGEVAWARVPPAPLQRDPRSRGSLSHPQLPTAHGVLVISHQLHPCPEGILLVQEHQ